MKKTKLTMYYIWRCSINNTNMVYIMSKDKYVFATYLYYSMKLYLIPQKVLEQ